MAEVGLLSLSAPVSLLKPNIWSNERFSSIRTKTCSMRMPDGSLRPPKRLPNQFRRFRRAQRIVSHATQISVKIQPNTTQIIFTNHAKALHTHLTSQYQAWQTQLATQYHAWHTQ